VAIARLGALLRDGPPLARRVWGGS
jgi:hypothetical protein